MTDQPTTPNLGNISMAAFLNLPDWSRTPSNQPGPNGEAPKPDTWAQFDTCVVALLYRLVRDNMSYINEAFACRVDTPLSLAAKAAGDANLPWAPTDFPAKALELADLAGVASQPTFLWNCNGNRVDIINQQVELRANGGGTDMVYGIVASRGSLGSGAPPWSQVYGFRNHAERWIVSQDSALYKVNEIAFQASYSLPEWPQDTDRPIVLAKVAHQSSEVDVGGGNRMNFEFGLGPAPAGDPNLSERDYVLYVRWYDVEDAEQYSIARIPFAFDPDESPIVITPGRRITLGFHRWNNGGNYAVDYYINGQLAAQDVNQYEVPGPSQAADIRLHVGSAQLGKSYTGGPFNNIALWDTPTYADVAGAMLALYRRGEGYETV